MFGGFDARDLKETITDDTSKDSVLKQSASLCFQSPATIVLGGSRKINSKKSNCSPFYEYEVLILIIRGQRNLVLFCTAKLP